MNVLLTGASGFLGRYIHDELRSVGAVLKIAGRGENVDYQLDLDSASISEIQGDYDMVIHNAGKAHVVPRSKLEEESFSIVNTRGTELLCSALERGMGSINTFVFVSTVAVYGLSEGRFIDESYPLNGRTPYARSKIDAEMFLEHWCKTRGVNLIILRLPLVAGENAPGNLNAMIKGIRSGKYFSIAKGKAQKSIVLAADVASLICGIGDKASGVFNLSDGHDPSFLQIEKIMAAQLSKKPPFSIPLWLAKLLGFAGDILPLPIDTDKVRKITSDLTFDSSLAIQQLNWNPKRVIDHYKI